MSYTDQDFEQTAASHTPGPWRAFQDAESCDVIAPDGYHVASVEPCNSVNPEAEQAANARLIAAAPDLLAALEQIAGYPHSDGIGLTPDHARLMRRQASAAIAKATGHKP